MAVWKNKFIQPNKYSRPQTKLTAVRKIVIHWTANFGATANGHYNYFNTLNGRYASAHLFVDKVEALCIVPLNEITYHANDGTYKGIQELKPNANFLSIGIEMCVEKDGSFHPETIERTIEVAVELCKMYKLDPLTDIVRHYDITHKNCPAPWVKNTSLFTAFKKDVEKTLNPKVVKPTPSIVTPVSKATSHTVVAGETFYSISRKYEIEVDKLLSYNPRIKSNALQVGDVIHLIPVPVSAIEKPVVAPKPVAPKPKPTPKPKPKPKPPVYKKLSYKRPLSKGSKGADVKALQEVLNKLNFKVGVADGSFGAKTEDAVKRFQSVYLSNEVDGFAGKNTINKINSLLK